MQKQSAGVLPYRYTDGQLQVFLVHPGGPFYRKKDAGVWSVAKGEYGDDEEPLAAAKREFQEETGQAIDGDFFPLSSVKYKNGKVIQTWAVEAEIAHTNIQSNLFEIEWPPRSGKMASFVEVDRADWFDIDTARTKLIPAQVALLDDLLLKLT